MALWQFLPLLRRVLPRTSTPYVVQGMQTEFLGVSKAQGRGPPWCVFMWWWGGGLTWRCLKLPKPLHYLWAVRGRHLMIRSPSQHYTWLFWRVNRHGHPPSWLQETKSTFGLYLYNSFTSVLINVTHRCEMSIHSLEKREEGVGNQVNIELSGL